MVENKSKIKKNIMVNHWCPCPTRNWIFFQFKEQIFMNLFNKKKKKKMKSNLDLNKRFVFISLTYFQRLFKKLPKKLLGNCLLFFGSKVK